MSYQLTLAIPGSAVKAAPTAPPPLPAPPAAGAPNSPFPGLLPHHLADLRESGLSDDTVRAGQFYSLTDAERIRSALNWERYNGRLGPCLAIPYFDADGRRDGLVRLKPDSPLTGVSKAGKPRPRKYEHPKGRPPRAYVFPAVAAAVRDPLAPLLVTEGEKKCAAAAQHGFACVGLAGVECWSKPRARGPDGKRQGERELIDDLDGIPWQGRVVHLVFDSDAADKPEVAWAEWSLAEALGRRGAVVKAVRLPAGEGGAKVGLDDFLAAHGAAALRELLDAAAEPRRPQRPARPREAADDPHRLARVYLAGQQEGGLRTLHRWRNEWHRREAGAYRTVSDEELRAEVATGAKAELDRLNVREQARAAGKKRKKAPEARKVTSRLVGDAVGALASLTMLPGRREAPFWVSGPAPFPAEDTIACPNVVVHLPALVAKRPGFRVPASPAFFCRNVLGCDFDTNAPPARGWLHFLGQLWPDDPQSVALLQDWFGYVLVPDSRLHRILLMVGPTRSGKGTIARVLTALVGAENVCSPSLGSLGESFGLWPLLGKSLAVVSDARQSGRTDTGRLVENLLRVSGDDPVDIHRKNLPTLAGVRLATRFMLLTNELPNLPDQSGAVVSRFVALHFTRSFLGREDPELTKKLLVELPGILLWAVEGWRRVRERGSLTQPESGAPLLDDLGDLSSPVAAFVRDCCLVEPGREASVDELFGRWRWWCAQNGHAVGARALLGRNLRAAVRDLKDPRQQRAGEVVRRVYRGIGLRPLPVARPHPGSPLAACAVFDSPN
jgi:putative DNA primase/helicase